MEGYTERITLIRASVIWKGKNLLQKKQQFLCVRMGVENGNPFVGIVFFSHSALLSNSGFRQQVLTFM